MRLIWLYLVLLWFCLVPIICEGKEVRPSADKRQATNLQVALQTESTWKSFCAHCHGSDGRPQTLVELPMPETPDFTQPAWLDYEIDDLVSSITDGTGNMPAFAGILTKSEVENLSRLILRLPKGRPGSLVANRWKFRQRDLELAKQLAALRLTSE